MPRRCYAIDCTTRSYFGLPNDKRATFCKKHKLTDMIDCDKIPSFGLPNDKRATYCSKHKSTDMIDIVHNQCYAIDCTKNPSFGLSTDKKATYCAKHKLENMIDIVSNQCYAIDCTTRPSFGLPDDKRATYCSKHKSIDMINIVNKQCDTCHLTFMNSKYKPNCAACHFYLNPNDPRTRNFKTKEQAYMNGLIKKFSNLKLDKTIDGGCSKRRPDGFIDLLTHVLVIEIDENEHKSYDDTCNNKRTMELSRDVNHRPIVFIRLNPDAYTFDSKRIKGTFSLTKATGELKVQKKEFDKRLNSLIESVENHMLIVPDKTISVEYLYFSNN
jgi:hypothetical protein